MRFLRSLPLILACAFVAEASASRLDEIGERIELLGHSYADAFHAACMAAGGPLSDELRDSAAERDRLKVRCAGAHEAWKRSAARLDESGDFAEVERLQRELLPCWDEIEAMQEKVKDQARSCLEVARPAPLFPLGFSELDTQAELAGMLHCQRRELCSLRPESIPSRSPGWLGQMPHQVLLGFSRVGIEEILSSVFVRRSEPDCESARDRLRAWSERLPAASWEGEWGGTCGPTARVASIGDHLVILMVIEEGPRHSAAALVVHSPWRILHERSFAP